MGWKIHQIDVKTTLFNGVIEEDIYTEYPEGFETYNMETHIYRLKRALYGLKQTLQLGPVVRLIATCSSRDSLKVMQIPISTI